MGSVCCASHRAEVPSDIVALAGRGDLVPIRDQFVEHRTARIKERQEAFRTCWVHFIARLGRVDGRGCVFPGNGSATTSAAGKQRRIGRSAAAGLIATAGFACDM